LAAYQATGCIFISWKHRKLEIHKGKKKLQTEITCGPLLGIKKCHEEVSFSTHIQKQQQKKTPNNKKIQTTSYNC